MNRVILVTGGSAGIGRAIAARFREAGDDVTVTGRDPERLSAVAGSLGVRTIRADASRPDDVEELARRLGSLDVLVNNAGGNALRRRTKPVESLSDVLDTWESDMSANLYSAVLTTAAFEDRMREGGSIISFGSIGAESVAYPYAAAKAAIAAWNAGLSRKLGARGITTNVVAPGYIEGTNFHPGGIDPGRRDRLVAATHNKRAGTVTDIAETVFFLASAGARHITGQTLHVNGGAHTTR
jgi:3-oxoacyl-[acyl-carrier protein] reductase